MGKKILRETLGKWLASGWRLIREHSQPLVGMLSIRIYSPSTRVHSCTARGMLGRCLADFRQLLTRYNNHDCTIPCLVFLMNTLCNPNPNPVGTLQLRPSLVELIPILSTEKLSKEVLEWDSV